MPSVMYGDDLVPVWRRPWRSAGDLGGFRMISELEVGQHWTEARVAPNMHEHLPVIDGAPVPVGVAIAADLIRDGADVAYCTELLMPRPLVTLDSLGRRVLPDDATQGMLDQVNAANGGSQAGLPDVVGRCGEVLVCREAKRRGKDYLGKTQHDWARLARTVLDHRPDLAVVEWDFAT